MVVNIRSFNFRFDEYSKFFLVKLSNKSVFLKNKNKKCLTEEIKVYGVVTCNMLLLLGLYMYISSVYHIAVIPGKVGLPMSCVELKRPSTLTGVRYICLLYRSPSMNDITSAEEERM